MIKQMILGTAAVMLVAGNVVAKDADKPTRFEKTMAKYERTGKIKNCLNPIRLNHSNVLDDFNIIFEVSPKQAYLTTLPRKCHRLGFHRAISYTVRGGQLCSQDTFRVFESGNPMLGPTCFFGKFEKIIKKSREQIAKEKAAQEAAKGAAEGPAEGAAE
ncbi:MAG: hypothetical protein JKY34_15295 [Kordiimonadaceae bacterium]|nr:hypothetical protein [Kordiimonadaceae bacterium]